MSEIKKHIQHKSKLMKIGRKMKEKRLEQEQISMQK